jgi:hypothetical protein
MSGATTPESGESFMSFMSPTTRKALLGRISVSMVCVASEDIGLEANLRAGVQV